MFRKFLKDIRGNYILLTAISMVPIMGGLAIAIDYTELTRQRSMTMSALDAAGIATARYIASGTANSGDPAVDEAAIKKYAKDFFEANLGAVKPISCDVDDLLISMAAAGTNFGS